MSLPPTSSSSASGACTDSTPLGRALEHNAAVKDTVEQSASELVVINAVLKQEIPDHVQVGDIAQALQRTDELEVKISDTAHDLARVNEVLAQEIDQRVDLERELAETKAALAEANGQPGS
jgi:C4-dicarboxylate-specific signal transduction histidine kinase